MIPVKFDLSFPEQPVNTVYCLVPENEIPMSGNYMEYMWHREDGPARITKYGERWWYYGRIHNYIGPASIDRDENSNIIKERWAINGNEVDETVYLDWLDEMGIDIKNLTPEDKLLIDMKWPR